MGNEIPLLENGEKGDGKMKFIKIALVASILLFTTNLAMALEPIPQESGFSGFIRPGVGVINYSGNMAAGLKVVDYDIAEERTDSLLDSPDSKTTALAILNLELAYTIAKTRTQIFVGNTLEDLVRFDLATQAGVRQELPDSSMLAVGYVFSGISTKVWKDPYVVNLKRQETSRNSRGVRLTWDKILGTQLQLQYTYRNFDINTEASGFVLGLPYYRARLLRRDGNVHSGEVLYRFNVAGNHWLAPAFLYTRHDRDGEAMSRDAWDGQLTYLYTGDPIAVVVNGLIGYADYDKRNPIYYKTQDDNRYGIGAQVYYRSPFGWKPFGSDKFSLFGNVAYYLSDANIDFYDTEVVLGIVGLQF